MDSREAIALLVQATFVGSAAIALVLLARRPLRRAFGARVAYAAWWLVPAALLALAVPAAPTADIATVGVRFAAPIGVATGLAGTPAGFAWQPWVLTAWATGAAGLALAMAAAQARFRAALGLLRPDGDAWRAEHARENLPATVGLLSPRIVLPADFDSRYEAEQRDLILAHERTHVARGDAWANLAMAALRCLCWFNPLVHLAVRRFRHDQELACDAIVVAHHPHSRCAYGVALFQAQLAAEAAPLACHFGFGHPLRERIAMLREPIATRRRRVAGNAAVAVLVSAAAFAAWATQPPTPRAQAAGTQAAGAQAAGAQAAGAHDAGTQEGRYASRMTLKPEGYVGEIRIPPPVYPKSALDAGIGGRVNLIIDVAADGRVTGVTVEDSTTADQRLVVAAAKNAWDWKFKPETRDGKPVAGRVRVPVTFDPVDSGAAGQG